MDFKVEEVNACTHKLVVTLSAQEVQLGYDRALRKVSKGVSVPGFRPGKVPRSLIERQYAPALQEEAQGNLVDSSLSRAVEQAKLEPVTMPKLQMDRIVPGQALTYTAFVEVRPTITLQQYKGLAVPPLDNSLPADAIDDALAQMRKHNAQLQPVTDRNTVTGDDVVQIDFEGFLAGTPFEGGKATNSMLEMADSNFIPGFAEGLLGASVPGERDIDVTFPADYHAKHLAGKAVVFKVALKELKSRVLPPLDDEFAKDNGEESLEALRAKISADLQSRRDSEAKDARRQAVLSALVAANPIEVPPSMVENQTDSLVQSAAARFERMMGGKKFDLKPEQWQALRQNSAKEAEFQVRTGLLLLEITRQEQIEVGDAEVEAEIERICADNPQQVAQVKVAYADPERRDQLHFSLLEDKTVDFLLQESVAAAAAAPSPAP